VFISLSVVSVTAVAAASHANALTLSASALSRAVHLHAKTCGGCSSSLLLAPQHQRFPPCVYGYPSRRLQVHGYDKKR
jgi:hypothetical protein